MFTLIYEFKLKPTNAQVAVFQQWLEQCRKVYNYALRERKDWVNSRKCKGYACSVKSEYIIPADTPAPTYNSQAVALTQAKKNIPGLEPVHSQVLQQTLKRLQLAFEGMWKNRRGFPRFKKPGRMRSFVFPALGKQPIQGNRIKLPKIGLVKFNQSRPIPDDAIIKLNLKALGKGFLAKHCLDAGWGQFLDVLRACCFKRGVYFQKVPAKGTSQTCPNCLEDTGKKKLSQRVHKCQFCGYTCDRDVASAQVVEIRGVVAVGHTVGKLSEGKGSVLEDVKLCLPVTEESPAF
ncbi:MAG: transposase [Coleofasciculus sp. D1-CHI-01]|uniref:RNA-guided endonuclease InsQ/TnpB family protein n=1 Tax=Coleofasciculus sp. D1-CHI-01 TaxID=3068482 RepID=UPI003302CCAB